MKRYFGQDQPERLNLDKWLKWLFNRDSGVESTDFRTGAAKILKNGSFRQGISGLPLSDAVQAWTKPDSVTGSFRRGIQNQMLTIGIQFLFPNVTSGSSESLQLQGLRGTGFLKNTGHPFSGRGKGEMGIRWFPAPASAVCSRVEEWWKGTEKYRGRERKGLEKRGHYLTSLRITHRIKV